MQINTDTVTSSKCDDGVAIFNNVSSVQNPVTWEELSSYTEKGNIYPSLKTVWYYCVCLNKHRIIHKIYVIFLHLLPALLIDTGAMIIGKQPR
jgi:fatty acyl-CoA reductase